MNWGSKPWVNGFDVYQNLDPRCVLCASEEDVVSNGHINPYLDDERKSLSISVIIGKQKTLQIERDCVKFVLSVP